MNRIKLGKWIMSFVLVAGAVVSTAVDSNTTHLFNPAWHPHARFHDALFLLILDATSLVTLWLLWACSRGAVRRGRYGALGGIGGLKREPRVEIGDRFRGGDAVVEPLRICWELL